MGGEVVSADSMQIYTGMDIGTAKVTPQEASGVPHHMIDIVSPYEDYSVARYVEDAERACRDIISRGKIPVIAGGTGLYIDSLLSGRSFSEGDRSSEIRQRLGEEYDSLGGEAMHERLRKTDPERAALLSPNDRRRIIRALEVYESTGKTITQHDAETKALPPRFEALKYALTYNDREKLYERINLRVDIMVRDGLFEETEGLLRSGLSPDSTAMQAIGYKETAMALRGEISREEAIELIKLGSRRYAKRQLTWLRRDPLIKWIERDDNAPISSLAQKIMNEFDAM